MPVPVVAPPANDPIDIDPGVTYHYVVACTGETGITVDAKAGFTLSVSGKTLSVNFSGTVLATPTVYPITVRVANASGVIVQKLNFRVGLELVVRTVPNFNLVVTYNSSDFVLPGIPNIVAVGDVIGVGSINPQAGYDPRLSGKLLYVKSVNSGAGTFKLSASPGGPAITATSRPAGGARQSNYPDTIIGMATSAAVNIWSETANLTVNQQIRLAVTSGGEFQGLPANLSGSIYVKAIIDDYHFTVSSTVGGAAIQATQSAWTNATAGYQIYSDDGARHYPDITSAASVTVVTSGTPSYTATSDLTPDNWAAIGLPSGVTINSSTGALAGTAPGTDGTYAIVLLVSKDTYTWSRWLVLIVGSGADVTWPSGLDPTPPDGGGGDPPGVFTFSGDAPSLIYMNAPSEWPVSQPVFNAPFLPADGTAYLYKIKYNVRRPLFSPMAIDSFGPRGGFHCGEMDFADEGAGIISFWREFAIVPAARDEFESFVYSFQIPHWGGGEDHPASITEWPLTVRTRLHFDYFHTNDPKTIPLAGAPRMLQDGTHLFPMNGFGSFAPGEEYRAVDDVVRCWKGRIYERVSRWVIPLTLGNPVS